MIFSRTVDYAIRAMTFLASQPAGKLTGAREISAAEGIPMPFLSKVLQKLARQKLVRSFKGSRGGYELARSADQITLHAILEAVDGEKLEGQCVLGLARCDEAAPCPLHDQWKTIRCQMLDMLRQTTAGDLVRLALHNREDLCAHLPQPSDHTACSIQLDPAANLPKMEAAAPKGTR